MREILQKGSYKVGELSVFVQRILSASVQILAHLNSDDEQHLKSLKTRHSIGAGGDVSIGADLLFEQIFAAHLLEIADLDSEESGKIKRENFAQKFQNLAFQNLASFENLNSEILQNFAPDSQILNSENSQDCENPNSQNPRDVVILDPLDGSDNFLSNIPYFGASLALADGKTRQIKEAAIINFCTKSAVIKSNGEIFKLDLQSTKISKIIEPDCQNLKCGIFEKAYSNPHIAKSLQQQNIKFRSLGASALSIALSLESKFFLFAGSIRKFDCAAGLFITQDLHIAHTEKYLLISRDKKVFDEILRILQV